MAYQVESTPQRVRQVRNQAPGEAARCLLYVGAKDSVNHLEDRL